MTSRLLFESDVIAAVDKHIDDEDKLDDDLSCILEEINSATIKIPSLPPMFVSQDKTGEIKLIHKQKRVQLYENGNIVLEQRGDVYYMSFYDKEGNFQKEITIDGKLSESGKE